ncbi:hypothetical protein [Rhodococcus sp. 1R11]|uniref:hypothetical protein n=1 Tax=Rhodococcus sp. 1R11 TaxID=2559614 RepID=UPI0010720DD6|nr:hypothetical protein [Rhodococcus sp. 1R11]
MSAIELMWTPNSALDHRRAELQLAQVMSPAVILIPTASRLARTVRAAKASNWTISSTCRTSGVWFDLDRQDVSTVL